MTNKFSENRPEGFYVEEGCCTACMAPHGVAPDLMGFDEENTICFIAKQPETEAERYQAIKMLRVSELGCIRYNGHDDWMKSRIVELGEEDQIDGKIPEEAKSVFRNIVQIQAPEDYHLIYSSEELVRSFMGYIFQNTGLTPILFEMLKNEETYSTFKYSWYEGDNHEVKIERFSEYGTKHIISHTTSPHDYSVGSRAVTFQIDSWLREELKAKNIRWYSTDEWEQNEEGNEYPY